jgi:hypothetical protein
MVTNPRTLTISEANPQDVAFYALSTREIASQGGALLNSNTVACDGTSEQVIPLAGDALGLFANVTIGKEYEMWVHEIGYNALDVSPDQSCGTFRISHVPNGVEGAVLA